MRNLAVAVAVTVGVVLLVLSGHASGYLLLAVLAVAVVAVGRSASRPRRQREEEQPRGSSWWRLGRWVAGVGRRGAAAGAGRAGVVWAARRRWWQLGPRHAAATVPCRYCRHRSATAEEALAHADTHVHDYAAEVAAAAPATADGPDLPGPDTQPEPDQPADQPVEEPPMSQQQNSGASPLGTVGRASIAGLVVDWETSVEAREHPETFVAWLQAQSASARHASTLVPDLVHQYHGRGPGGQAGVPDQILNQFAKSFEDARALEAEAYARFAAEYAAHVNAAEHELTQTYGREVLGAAHAAHRG